MKFKISLLVLAGVMALVAGPRNSDAGPITFNSALPVAKGEFILRGQAVLKRSSDDPSSMDLSVCWPSRGCWPMASVGIWRCSVLCHISIRPWTPPHHRAGFAEEIQDSAIRRFSPDTPFSRSTGLVTPDGSLPLWASRFQQETTTSETVLGVSPNRYSALVRGIPS